MVAGGQRGHPDRCRADHDAAEGVDEEVPPEVDRRQRGQHQERPGQEAQRPACARELHQQAHGDREADVQGRERGDGLQGVVAGRVAEHDRAVGDHRALQGRHRGLVETGEGAGVGVDRPERREREVRRRTQRPVDGERGHEPGAERVVAGPDQRPHQGQRDQGDPGHVDQREHRRGHALAEDRVQHGRRVVAEPERVVEPLHRVVPQRPVDERDGVLEVAERRVGDVPAGQPDEQEPHLARTPALMEHGPEGRDVAVLLAAVTQHHSGEHVTQEGDEEEQREPDVGRTQRVVVGVADRQPLGRADQDGRDRHHGSEHHHEPESGLPHRATISRSTPGSGTHCRLLE